MKSHIITVLAEVVYEGRSYADTHTGTKEIAVCELDERADQAAWFSAACDLARQIRDLGYNGHHVKAAIVTCRSIYGYDDPEVVRIDEIYPYDSTAEVPADE